jgi:hypothetical protein
VQFIDGGVMDNLPLDAVMQFLTRAAEPRDMKDEEVAIIKEKPLHPHLIIAASLEVSAPQYMLAYTRRQLQQSWLSLRKRAKQLGYNRKLETYQLAQADGQDCGT